LLLGAGYKDSYLGRGSRVEQSAGWCQFVAIAVDIQETA